MFQTNSKTTTGGTQSVEKIPRAAHFEPATKVGWRVDEMRRKVHAEHLRTL